MIFNIIFGLLIPRTLGKQYVLRYRWYHGNFGDNGRYGTPPKEGDPYGSDYMFKARFQNCPRIGDSLETGTPFKGSLQWKVVDVEHLEGNTAVIHVIDAHGRKL